ncbi:MAG: phosphoribosylglycinamide formyltransferase [Acidobacteriota bacterium]|nr:phosphoribosylglycinamide formyltransferase [Acidobacteriota bacterium]MDE3138935.1 phosphoribosylglycinamide formyltransferase [Acidobacteriota bacterium]MDE3146178.1 phosphoribosylglycinamide formyltransferase [Acidobacteriota bacterium]
MGVRLCVLVSGSGTILEALIEQHVHVALVGADRPCRGLDVAARAGVETLLLDRADYGGFSADFDRARYSKDLATALRERGVDLVAMAGFGTVVTAEFHDAFPGRVLNTHPSLLPDFKGWHAVAQALASGVDETGCTVHVATVELDDGPILAQRRVAVRADDSEASLHERIKGVERVLYPMVVTRVMAALDEGRSVASVAREMENV